MRFLVTGASGFIGDRLIRQLAAQYGLTNVQGLALPNARHNKEHARVGALLRDGYDLIFADLLQLPSNFASRVKPFDVLFHLAAFGETESKQVNLNRVNDTGTQILIDALQLGLKGKRVIFTSSLAAVDRGSADNTPQGEDYPCHPRTAYGKSKLVAESIIKQNSAETAYQWIIARLTTVVGPGYRPGGLVEVLEQELRANKLFARLNWPGRIELVDVEDVASVLIKLGTQPITVNRIYHVCSGITPTLDALIEGVARQLNIHRNRIVLPQFFWKFLSWLIWLPGLPSILPFRLQVVLWRLSLIVGDGFVGDGRLLSQTIQHCYLPFNQMLVRAYHAELSENGVALATK